MRCLVTFVDEGSQRISLSTADLEEVDGDMLLNQVYFAYLPTVERRSHYFGASVLGNALSALSMGASALDFSTVYLGA